MALSMDEQRMLDEMERKLADDDPMLASRLRSFGHPGLTAVLRSPRVRIVAAGAALVVIAVVSVVVYALAPFRDGGVRQAPTRTAAPHGVTTQMTPAGQRSTADMSGKRAH
ncbi:MAG: DUF3040 domain-containing protein [Streptosporangiaceae bacterium]|jgi:hypothetical protein